MRLSTLNLLALFLGLFQGSDALRTPSDSVLLSNIKSLTLRAGQQTTARRSSAIPQLSCIGGNARDLYAIDVMRCENSGSDYDDANVQWTCKASLPSEFKLGSTDVECEGYSSPEDPYVLKGSCGVKYRLVLTEEGESKYGHRDDWGDRDDRSASKGEKVIFWAFFTFVAGMICYGIWDSCVRGNNRRPPPGNQGYGGGWGGDDDNDDPPPPYTPSQGKGGFSRGYGTQGNQAWRPGFWSGAGAGAAAGAAAGYMAGNRGNSSRSAGRSSGGWGGSSSSSSSPPAPSTSRYESTGFGSSSRR